MADETRHGTRAISDGWCIAVYRADRAETTEAEEQAALASIGAVGTERLDPGGWIASIPEALATLDGADVETQVDGIDWIIEVPGV